MISFVIILGIVILKKIQLTCIRMLYSIVDYVTMYNEITVSFNKRYHKITILNERTIQQIIRSLVRYRWTVMDQLDQVTLPNSIIICPICKKSQIREDYTILISECAFLGGKLERYQCPDCDVIFGPQKMLNLDKTSLKLEYLFLYRFYSEGDTTEFEKRTFFELNPQKTGKYLNFGCGKWSRCIDELRSEGWEVYGYEPYVEESSPYIINDIEILNKMKFDGIFSNNLIEHLKDPISEIKQILRLLIPGGIIAHSTSCFEYSYEHSRFHLFFFTGRSFNYVLNSLGLIQVSKIIQGEYICVSAKKT
jgi:hypothetical protein